MKELKEYFHLYITPVHDGLQKQKADYKQINYIEITVIRTLLFELVNAVSLLQNVELIIDIENPIKNVSMKDMDIFIILNVFIENAAEEVTEQEQGSVYIFISEFDNRVLFRIENSIQNSRSMEKPFHTHKGLEIVRGILKNYTNVNLYTNLECKTFIQIVEVNNN